MTRGLIKAVLIGLAACLTFGQPIQATESVDGFNRGNTLYAAGDFAGAVAAYEGQVRAGSYTANLFYNLADAYYRQGNRGRAVLNYQRALLLDPAHSEAAANLAFVRGSKPGAPARAGWIAAPLPWLSAAAGWLAVAGLVVALSARRARTAGFGLMSVGLLTCAGGAGTIWALDDSASDTARAVVVADSAPARYEPADNSKVVTTLTAGGEVRVLSDQGAWTYALLGDGTHAWLAADKIERLVPR